MKQNGTFETNLEPKCSKFCCNICDYNTSRISQYTRHLDTEKHKNRQNETNMKQMKQYINEKFKCNCGLDFNSRTTLWRHKKKCNSEKEDKKEEHVGLIDDKELITMLVKQNAQLLTQHTDILEILKNGTHNTSQSHNTNSLNKTFNLQFFLNETCKDAMNLMEFVDSIKLQLSDLEKVGEMGYIEGISNIITSNLKTLDITKRPIHCTDKKREIIYVKDDDKWEKEDEDKKKIRKLIKKVTAKNQNMVHEFKKVHPDCIYYDSKYSDQYNKIMLEAMGGFDGSNVDKENKIIRKISHITTIDKDMM
jgi:hypothetical protein